MPDLSELYMEVILDHNRSPRNFRALPDADRVQEGHNPLCGDSVTLYLRLSGNSVEEAAFQGSGCAISTASASLLTEFVRGKSLVEVEELFGLFRDMVTGAGEPSERLGKLCSLAGVKEYPARVKCATLAWHALLAALKGKSEAVNVEELD